MLKAQCRDIDLERTFCMTDLLHFTRYFFKKQYKRKFVVGKHHELISNAIMRVYRGELTRLIINIAPRYGKTEIAVKNFIAMGLAINPQSKFIHLSYSDSLARDNSQGVMDIVSSDAYQRLFPEVKLSNTKAQHWRTTEGGGVYAVSSAGQVTGFGAGNVDEEDDKDVLERQVTQLDETTHSISKFSGAIVIDDPIKPDDANSAVSRNKVNVKFETTIRNRVNSRNTPIIIIMQRLDIDDLCGYLQRIEPDAWEVLSIPCIETDENGEEKALWEFKHTLSELKAIRDANSIVFETQYMQNPKPLQGLMYEHGFRTYEKIPYTQKNEVKAYVDTADTGKDYLCCIVYTETPTANYIMDVLYTQKDMDYTKVAVAEMLTKYEVKICNIEGNNGGRIFASSVESQLREMRNLKTRIATFHQTQNKQVRIFSRSVEVQNMCFFPEGWDKLYTPFYNAIANYKKTGTNDHDDAPDALTGTIEKRNGFDSGALQRLVRDAV